MYSNSVSDVNILRVLIPNLFEVAQNLLFVLKLVDNVLSLNPEVKDLANCLRR